MRKIQNIERIYLITSFLTSILFISLLVFVKWPKWWEYVIFERTPMTWFESILLFSCSLLAFICALLNYLNLKNKNMIIWLVISIGFTILTLDERFAIHERIRDLFLAPNGLKFPLFFWTPPGDFILLLICFISLAFVPFIYKLLKKRKLALLFFKFAFILTLIAVILDSMEWKTYSIQIQRIEQFVEEIIETIAMLFYLNSFFVMFTPYLKNLENSYNEKIT